MDFYGKRLATASSDRTIRIHDISDPATHKLTHTLKGHEGPVWAVDWSHPKYGNLLASASYDGKVIIWKEDTSSTTSLSFQPVYTHSLHSASVNCIQFAPVECGLMLACGSSDGKVSIISYNESGWVVSGEWVAHSVGVNALSWAPSSLPGSLISVSGADNQSGSVRKLVTGGSDNLCKIWKCTEDGKWSSVPECVLEGHGDWIRDVSWAPNLGLPVMYIASCSQDRTVVIWSLDSSSNPSANPSSPTQNNQNNGGNVQNAGAKWTKKMLKPDPFPDAVWRVSWSLSAHLLAVSSGDNRVALFRMGLSGEWECVGEMDDVSTSGNGVGGTGH